MSNALFRKLTPEEIKDYRDWAYENYTPGNPVPGIWHPAVRVACEQMNLDQVQGTDNKENNHG